MTRWCSAVLISIPSHDWGIECFSVSEDGIAKLELGESKQSISIETESCDPLIWMTNSCGSVFRQHV